MVACGNNLIKYHEEACKSRRRRMLTQFCQDVLVGRNIDICAVINSCNFSLLNIGEMNLTRDTFIPGFESVCEELFILRSPQPSYIIAVLAYALELHEYHRDMAWYDSNLLILPLTDVLITNGCIL